MRWSTILFLLTTLLFVKPVDAQEVGSVVAQDLGPIETDLAALADPAFKVREAAAKRLAARKINAVAPLTQLALTGSPEASVRAIDILRQIYRDGDEDACEAVEASLETLVASENIGVAARTETSILGLGSKWHRRAVETFVKLGGIVKYSDPSTGEAPAEEDLTNQPIKYAIINKSWRGGNDGVKYLRRFEEFRTPPNDTRANTVFIVNGTVAKDAINALRVAMPALLIQERGPACLGISQSFQGERGVAIGIVKPGSAADRAGLKSGDVVLKFDGNEVNDFDSLVDKIGEKEPGDKVVVEFERGNEVKETTVQLRGWE